MSLAPVPSSAAGSEAPARDAAPAVNPVRVLYCEGNIDGTVGGSCFSLLYLIEGLDRARFEPHVVFHRDHILMDRFRRAANEVTVMERLPPFHFRALATPGGGPVKAILRPVQSTLNLVQAGRTVLRHWRFLRSHGIGLLHLNNSVTRGHEWMLAARLAGVPCVVHERGINEHFSQPSRRLASGVGAIICISTAVRDTLAAAGVGGGNLKVIWNGLDPARVVPSRPRDEVLAAIGVPPGRPVIGVIGNIKRWKGQEVLVRALPAIIRRAPDVVCVFVGDAAEPDLYYLNRMKDAIRELRLEDRVVFAGYTTNVADYLNVFDVAVHTSVLPEPFGRVLLEAMALRKPVVGSGGGAVPEIVEHGRTGYTFKPGDPDDLADRVADLLERPAAARACGEAGYRRLVDHFGIAGNVAATMQVYDSVLRKAATTP